MNCAADPRLLPLLASLREPAVRALASLLLGPSPWDSGVEFDRALLAGPRAAERLLALDRRPAVLLDWLAARRTGRLGAHAEALLAFWLAQRSAQLELVAANRAVRVEAHTLGEFDFLLRLDGRPLHVEMACKFYLEVAPQCWAGTDLRDALALKRAQLVRQLALAGEGIACLSDFMTGSDRQAGTLLPVLAEITLDVRQPIHAVYYRNTQLAARIACFLDFVSDRIGADGQGLIRAGDAR